MSARTVCRKCRSMDGHDWAMFCDRCKEHQPSDKPLRWIQVNHGVNSNVIEVCEKCYSEIEKVVMNG